MAKECKVARKQWWEFYDEVWASGKYDLTEDEKTAINSLYNVILGTPVEEKDFLGVVFEPMSEIRNEWRFDLIDFYKKIVVMKCKTE